MKRCLILFVLCISCLICNGQVLNKKGLKVVSKIEVYFGGKDVPSTIYTFDYNSDLSLKKLSSSYVYDEGSEKLTIERVGNILKRSDYKDGKSTPYIYRYKLNGDGYVIERDEKCMDIYNRGYLRKHRVYTYKEDNLYKMDERRFSSDDGKTEVELSDRYLQYFKMDENGNLLNGKYSGYNWRQGRIPWGFDDPYNWKNMKVKYDTSVINDTNLNLQYLIEYGYDIDMITEWYDLHSNNMIFGHGGQSYEYIIEDGNLVEIKHYNKKTRYKIYYLEE